MKFGIDKLGFYIPNYYLDLKTFAEARGHETSKYYEDLGQHKMSVSPPNEDAVTLALNAADNILTEEDIVDIEMVIFATESSQDLSKAASSYIHKMFNLPPRCRIIELKQACYSATFGLQMAISWLKQNPNKKVLLVASDIAHYELESTAESSQGAGAVAMIISKDPRLLEIEPGEGFCTKETMDFWRPKYLESALVDGQLSCNTYMRLAEETWKQYTEITGKTFSDHDYFCYHVPLAKLVESTHKRLAKTNKIKLTKEQIQQQLEKSLIYNKEVGNCYTASLYLSIISLLENETEDLSGKLLGLYSYGSGSIGEFFGARIVPGYKNHLQKEKHQKMLTERNGLTISQYEDFHKSKLPETGSMEMKKWDSGRFYLKEIKEHQHIYESGDNV